MKFQLFAESRLLRRKQWRWRLKANNGRIIATSGEGYNNKADAIRMLEMVRGDRKIQVEEV